MVSIKFALSAAASLAAAAVAGPLAAPMPTPAPDLSQAQGLFKRTSCTFSGSNGYSLASVSQKSCATIVLSALSVPSGVTLNLSDLEDDTTVIFEGETTFAYAEWTGPLLQIEGTGITIQGASGATLNGNGADYWDGEGDSGGVTKPTFFYAHSLTDSTITDLYIENTPVQAVSIDGADGLTITDMTINNQAGASLGKNTDGFDIADSTNVVITGATVYNQDDCVAINSGTSITVENSFCSGGHGLSIGSVGGRSDNTVETIKFSNNQVESSANGIRIKATEGDTGTISGVTYEDITLSDITSYGIIIEQNYDGGDLDGGTPTSGIPITNLVLDSISGSDAVESSAYNIVIVCGTGACSDWTWTDVTVTGGQTYDSCTNVPSGISCA